MTTLKFLSYNDLAFTELFEGEGELEEGGISPEQLQMMVETGQITEEEYNELINSALQQQAMAQGRGNPAEQLENLEGVGAEPDDFDDVDFDDMDFDDAGFDDEGFDDL